ncbi:MAG: transporter ATP-binding protein [Glaciihabitans sp.]|nr:transporter ATP-binding protein [Glaciihabitans sp.]
MASTGIATVVELAALCYNYGAKGEFPAVKELSLTVRRGELYALLGTNGAGKTTTLETIEGHRAPSAGTVTVFGGSPTDRRTVRPRVGIMLQETGYAADLTCHETLNLVGALSGRSDDADRILGKVALQGKRDTRVGQLSGGERRRLDFGSAIWGSPELLFLDEPTTGLDPTARDVLWEVVAELRRGGCTIILTTHYLEEAEKHADRIGLMHKGVLATEGTLAELVAGHPSHITFVTPEAAALPLPGDTVGNRTVIETSNMQGDLHTLLVWAAEKNVTLEQLTATSSSLDDVFRTLTRT